MTDERTMRRTVLARLEDHSANKRSEQLEGQQMKFEGSKPCNFAAYSSQTSQRQATYVRPRRASC